MSTIASVRIEAWGSQFVVVGAFHDMTEIPRQTFLTYREALKEMAKVVAREEIRYESHLHNGIDWPINRNQL